MTLRRAALLALLAGCVVPPDIEEARPPPGNQPPFALRAWPEPGVIRLALDCLKSSPQTFTLKGISDCDPADTVSARWFVNYDPEAPTRTLDDSFRGGPGVTQCVRSPGETTFQLNAVDVAQRAGVIHLEAVLSDGFAADDVAPRYRAPLPGKAVTRIGWTIEIFEGTGCPL